MHTTDAVEEDRACFPMEEQKAEEVGDEGARIDDEDCQGDEVSGEVESSRKTRQPCMPTEQERREHELTHCPLRCWCEHCIRGQGAEYQHSTVTGANATEDVPRVIMDYCFLLLRR